MITNVFMAKQQATDLIWQQQGEFSDINDSFEENECETRTFCQKRIKYDIIRKKIFDNTF